MKVFSHHTKDRYIGKLNSHSMLYSCTNTKKRRNSRSGGNRRSFKYIKDYLFKKIMHQKIRSALPKHVDDVYKSPFGYTWAPTRFPFAYREPENLDILGVQLDLASW